jgi:serine/threonine-protein kinase RsbW
MTVMSAIAESLEEVYPAVAESVPVARAALVELAIEAGASEEQVDAVRLASSEAVTNAVLHAYPDGPGLVYVTGTVVSDELWVLITDDGCGLRPRAASPGLGFGLALISQVSDEFSLLNRSSGGTEVRMRFSLLAAQREARSERHSRGSVAAATRPASASFSTTE